MVPDRERFLECAKLVFSLGRSEQKEILVRLHAVLWAARYAVTAYEHGTSEDFERAMRFLGDEVNDWDLME